MVDCMECTNFIECHYSGQLTGRLTSCPDFKQKPMTNAQKIRAMTDEELAKFIANKIVNLENYKMLEKGHTPTATQLSALGHTCYCALVQWLKQPAEGGCVMYYIHGGRASGKTTYLIMQSAKYHVPIMVTNSPRKGFIQHQAKWLGVSIPEPIVWNPGAHNDGLRVRDVFVDDGEDFLHHVLFHTVRAKPMAMAISEPVVELPAKEE